MLAIHKADGAFVALDPSQPVSHTCYILGQTDTRMVIASRTQKHLFEGSENIETLMVSSR